MERGLYAILCGSFENWRVDSYKFPYDTLGEELDGWDGERW